MIDLSLFY